MLIRDKDYLGGITYKGDEFTMHHVQPNLNIQKEAHEIREHSDNGWTKERTMRQIGHIPALEAVRLQAERPGFFSSPEMIREYLMKEGAAFRTVKKGI